MLQLIVPIFQLLKKIISTFLRVPTGEVPRTTSGKNASTVL